MGTNNPRAPLATPLVSCQFYTMISFFIKVHKILYYYQQFNISSSKYIKQTQHIIAY